MNKQLCENFLRSIPTDTNEKEIKRQDGRMSHLWTLRMDGVENVYHQLCEISKEYTPFYYRYFMEEFSYLKEKKCGFFIIENDLLRTKSFIVSFSTEVHENYHCIIMKKNVEQWNQVPAEIRQMIEEIDKQTGKYLQELLIQGCTPQVVKEKISEYEKESRKKHPEIIAWEDQIENEKEVLYFPYIGNRSFTIPEIPSPSFSQILPCISDETKKKMEIYELYVNPKTCTNACASDFFSFIDEFGAAFQSINAEVEYFPLAVDLFNVNEEKKVFDFKESPETLIKNDSMKVEYRFKVWLEYFYVIAVFMKYAKEHARDFFNSIYADEEFKKFIQAMCEQVAVQKSKYIEFRNQYGIKDNCAYNNTFIAAALDREKLVAFIELFGISANKVIQMCNFDELANR